MGSKTQTQSQQSSRYRNDNTGGSSQGIGGSAILNLNGLNQENEPKNIMHDRRVIRGSTYSLRRSIESKLNKMESANKSSSKRVIKRKSKNRKKDHYKVQTQTPRPVSGRLHQEIQTDAYLEKIHVTKQQMELSTQTDPFLDYPSAPLFEPKLSGPSIATQIEEGDLFDFDREVEPILEVLIGKTIEQSLMEVLEEEELRAYAAYKSEFEQKRNVEIAKCQQLEEEERRKLEEKERRLAQAEKQKQAELELKERIEAQRIATEFLEQMEDAVFAELDAMGYFYDPIVKEIEDVFLPQLMRDAEAKVNDAKISNAIMDDVIDCFVVNMMNDSMKVIAERDEQLRELEQNELAQNKLNAEFEEKRSLLTQTIKLQRQDYDFKQQIIQFLDIPIKAPPKEKNIKETGADADVEDNENKEDAEDDENDEEEQELPPEIQQNIEFIDGLMEQFENDEEPLYKQIADMLDKIGGETMNKIERIDQYLESFSIKTSKRALLDTLELYKEEPDNLKKAICDCLGVDSFNDELHTKLFDGLMSEEQKDKMESINQLVNEKNDINQFVTDFIKQKEDERIAADQAAKEKEIADQQKEEEDDDENMSEKIET